MEHPVLIDADDLLELLQDDSVVISSKDDVINLVTTIKEEIRAADSDSGRNSED